MKIIASVAVSLDGYIDDSMPKRLVLSGEEDWQSVHDLRAKCDAILVGANTIRRDDPSLSIKDPKTRARRVESGLDADIVKVTVSLTGNISNKSRFLTVGQGKKLIYHSSDKLIDTPSDQLVEYVYLVSITSSIIKQDLESRGYRTLLVEGGSQILTAFLEEDMIDEMRFAIAPFFVGDAKAPRFVGDGKFPFNKERRMKLLEVKMLGDMAVMYYDLRDEK